MNTYTNIFTGLPDADVNILHQLDDNQLYHTCLVNKYSYNLCQNDKILRDRFNHYNVLLQADLKTTQQLCLTYKLASQWCQQELFWINKFNAFNFYLPIDINNINNYIKHFGWYEESNIIAKIIMKINDIEKNRVFDHTKGIIIVRIESMEANNLDLLLNDHFPRNEYDEMDFNEMVFELKDQNYFIKLRKWRKFDIDVGYKSLKEVEKLLTYTLTMTGICEDDLDCSFLSMKDELFDEQTLDVLHLKKDELIRVCLRRGLWEGMLTL